MKDAPAEDTRQERYRRYQRYEERNRRHKEKKKAVEASGFHRNRQDGKSGRRCKQSLIQERNKDFDFAIVVSLFLSPTKREKKIINLLFPEREIQQLKR